MKILPTVGPLNSKINDLKYLAKNYSVVRLNGSHNTVNWHKNISINLKKFNKDLTILIDLPGSKPRIKINQSLLIKQFEEVIFFYGKKPKVTNNKKCIEISNPLPKIPNLNFFLVNDNQFVFNLTNIKKNSITGISRQKFLLENKKGLNLPGAFYDEKIQKKNVLNFIKKIIKSKVRFDAIGLSYVQSEALIRIINIKYPKFSIVSKIENSLGVKNSKAIIKNSDAVMIDRGDLSAEIGDQKLFSKVEDIISICKKFSKPVIMATQNLLSMNVSSTPSQSEIFAIGYAYKNYIDMLMLSDETAINKKWKNTLRWLNSFLKKNKNRDKKNEEEKVLDIWSILNVQKKTNIIIFTKKGYSFNKLDIKKENNYFIYSENQKLMNITNFYSNISFEYVKFQRSKTEYIKKAIKLDYKKIFNNGRPVILVTILFPKKNSRVNTLTLLSKKDYV